MLLIDSEGDDIPNRPDEVWRDRVQRRKGVEMNLVAFKMVSMLSKFLTLSTPVRMRAREMLGHSAISSIRF